MLFHVTCMFTVFFLYDRWGRYWHGAPESRSAMTPDRKSVGLHPPTFRKCQSTLDPLKERVSESTLWQVRFCASGQQPAEPVCAPSEQVGHGANQKARNQHPAGG